MVQVSFYAKVVENLAKAAVDPLYTLSQAWADAVAAIFFEPWGVKVKYSAACAQPTPAVVERRPRAAPRAASPIRRCSTPCPPTLQAGEAYFSWNESTVADIVARNPDTLGPGSAGSRKGRGAVPFLLPRSPERPFPIFVGTVVGPRSVEGDGSWLGGLAPCNRSFTQLHVTPLCVVGRGSAVALRSSAAL